MSATAPLSSISSSPPALFLGRQPILDRSRQIVAYELLFRSGLANFAQISDNAQATATVILHAFSELSIGDALGASRGFINVDESILFSDTLELLPRDSVVLEILETVVITPDVVERCRALKAAGYTLALDDVIQLGPEYLPLLELVDIVKLDLKPIPAHELPGLVAEVRQRGLQLLAEKIDTEEEFKRCLDLGFDLFQGYFFARPTIIQGRKLDPARMNLLRLMNLVLTDADDQKIEALLKQEPGLILKLLRMTNSVAVGASTPILSLRQALMVLGRRQLQRWLQLLLYAGGSGSEEDSMVNPLMVLAATRARLMELLSEQMAPRDRAQADRAFMTGLLSLAPTLFGIPMEDIVSQLSLDEACREALCATECRDPSSPKASSPHLLCCLLKLVQCLEGAGMLCQGNELEHLPGLASAQVNLCLSRALAWANTIGQESSH